jgi:outer membrane murein-binding lipoprotein Lpp
MLIRVLLSIFFLLVLGGCEEQEVPTKPTVETLQKQLQEQLGTRQAEIQLAERVVTAYQVCSWIVNTCTRQVEIEGAKAETLGHTGATNVALWAGLFSRGLLALLALALLIQMSKALASWTRLAIVEPKRERVQAAQTLLDNAQVVADHISAAALAQVKELETQCNQLRCDWWAIADDTHHAEQKLWRLKKEIDAHNQNLVEAKAKQTGVDIFNSLE